MYKVDYSDWNALWRLTCVMVNGGVTPVQTSGIWVQIIDSDAISEHLVWFWWSMLPDSPSITIIGAHPPNLIDKYLSLAL